MRIMALDPGTTTGWASIEMQPGKRSWRQGMLGPEAHHLQLYSLLHDFAPDVVIYEGFEYRNDSRDGLVLDSREYIGIAKLWAQEHDRPVVLQPPSSGKIRGASTEGTALVKKRNLQKLGLWRLGPESEHHMVDAMGHLLYYLLTSKDALSTQERKALLVKGGWR